MRSTTRRQIGIDAGIISARCQPGRNRRANGSANNRWCVGFAVSSARMSAMLAAVWLIFATALSLTVERLSQERKLVQCIDHGRHEIVSATMSELCLPTDKLCYRAPGMMREHLQASDRVHAGDR